MGRPPIATPALGAVLFLLWAPPASACAVCYGNAESAMVQGLEASVLFMVGVTYFVIFGVVASFVILRRRAAGRNDAAESDLTQQQQGA